MDLTKQKFLVVDDSAMVRDHIERLLKQLGAVRVDKVENGKEALQKLKRAANEQLPYALVTLDWEMPEMTGLEALKAVRADPQMKSQPVLMVSSKAESADLIELAPLQPNGFIVKPFTDELFLARAKALLQISLR